MDKTLIEAVARALADQGDISLGIKTDSGRLMDDGRPLWEGWVNDAQYAITAHLKHLEDNGMVIVSKQPVNFSKGHLYESTVSGTVQYMGHDTYHGQTTKMFKLMGPLAYGRSIYLSEDNMKEHFPSASQTQEG